MKKNQILKTLEFLKESLDTYETHEAIELLESRLDSIEYTKEPSVREKGNDTFSLTDKVKDKENHFALFSDGACRGNPGPGSWGCIGQDWTGKVIFEASGVEMHTTNNKMELSGAIESIKSLASNVDKIEKIVLYTDSKYIVDGMRSWVAGWKKRGWKKADKKTPENLDLWQKLDSQREEFPIEFEWVKGHAGHPQNERCDELANLALDESGF